MPLTIDDLPAAIRAAKISLRAGLPEYAKAFRELEGDIARQVDAMRSAHAHGGDVIPVLPFLDIARGTVDPRSVAAIRARGACVIRGVFDARQASDWNDEIGTYVDANRLADKLGRRAEDFRQVYRHVLTGNWRAYDPFDAAFRPDVEEIPSPAVCSMFRTFQGWTTLTPQGPGDGTLQLIPMANAMAYVVLRALQDDVADDDLCGARPGRALSILPEWHALLLDALVPIPHMEPGDAVFWHGDVVHAVEDAHRGSGDSNVMYIAAAPGCAKNGAYLRRQLPAFLRGESPPDFPADHFENEFDGRAGEGDLTALGRAQMGFDL